MTAFTAMNRQSTAPYHGAGDVVRAISGGFAILHGSLAPEGCAARLEGFDAPVFDGPARVFEGAAEALAGIQAGRVRSCDILVIRDDARAALSAAGLQAIHTALDEAQIERVTLITDGRIGDGQHEAVIGHVAPSASARGPIAYVNDDDIIHVDLAARRIDVLADIDMRRGIKAQKPGMTTFGAGALQKYARLVTAAHS
ncbi:dihydroxy-acid dehydratase [Asticcacaulis sp. EMRT-3]|uniref:dihydroxy-acid dehydratase domain-containing protein n=1 Tax=Asticcacaulis sp. EMRT-3 TaxID=3040349 RepID=UPI0024AF0A46|nr:dihydroxy-acid dehydratase [Asticcacaulis sp. EMRT-3]MDI7775474.1 dihydroxy-acid dehydratase [Asticcacaulis sp. EMRT-3]